MFNNLTYAIVHPILLNMYDLKPAQSPYSQDFESILDPDIRNLVLTLLRKGYLPCYSCQGHALSKPRYFVLAFGSNQSRQEFLQKVFLGKHSTAYPYQELETLSSETIKGEVIDHVTREQEILGLNQLFFKNYEAYCFLRIHIGLVIDYKQMGSMEFIARQIHVVIYNFLFRQILTHKLLDKIEKLEFTPN